MDRLESVSYSHSTATEFYIPLLDACLQESKGQPEMSASDTKMAILSLKRICERQEMTIQALLDEVTNLKNRSRNPFKR